MLQCSDEISSRLTHRAGKVRTQRLERRGVNRLETQPDVAPAKRREMVAAGRRQVP